MKMVQSTKGSVKDASKCFPLQRQNGTMLDMFMIRLRILHVAHATNVSKMAEI